MNPLEAGAWEWPFIERQPVARLATVDTQGKPHIVPIVFAFDESRLFTPIDAKPKRSKPHQLQRVRNIQANPNVAVLFDEYNDDWRKLAWVQVRGVAEFITSGPVQETGLKLLADRYPQYTHQSLAGRPIIVITVLHITGWRATG